MKILFVCFGNAQRSPSFEKWFKDNSSHNVMSAGTDWQCPCPVTDELLDWADKVFVMDIEQELYINEHHHDFLPKIEVIGVSDQYSRESPEINRIIRYWAMKKELTDELFMS